MTAMEKTLYISDLDGTLLNNSGMISERTAALLNEAVREKNIFFTIATARTAATAVQLLSAININAPMILMNGVCIFDAAKGSYVKVNTIAKSDCEKAMDVLARHGLHGFWYSVADDRLSTYYERVQNDYARRFMDERVSGFRKVFTRLENIRDCLEKPLVYFSLMDKKERLESAAEELKSIEGIRIEFYRDTYIEGYWYLEICSAGASKANAVCFLREEYGFGRVIGFGDNYNDMPMFGACDLSCAMANAVPDVKKAADAVIGDNDADGVAEWISLNA